jgi:two-component system nitrogen regulation sensor histidine kinase NtrY
MALKNPPPPQKSSRSLEPREQRKRKRERILIVGLTFLVIALTLVEFKLSRISSSLPFVNSIFFFGLINFNIVIAVALLWLIFKNVGKIFLERRSRLLGSRLKTKLVTAFIGFSIIPTLTLFLISVLYINQSFDKWFSLKIQNTLQSSLEISSLYYNNAEQRSDHFATLIASQLNAHFNTRSKKNKTKIQLEPFLEQVRTTYALNAVELYTDPLNRPLLAVDRESKQSTAESYARLPLDRLQQIFSGSKKTFVQNVSSADLVRSAAPIVDYTSGKVKAAVVVSVFIPVNLTAKAGQIANVAQDYKETNPLQYPIKTTYLVILILITLLLIFAEIWMGLYLARELTVPVERLVKAAQDVGRGRLDIVIEKTGDDEIAVLVDSFNSMTSDLRDNQYKLRQRTQQLEAILANIAAGVVLIDDQGKILTINNSALKLLDLPLQDYFQHPLVDVVTLPDYQTLLDSLNAALKNAPAADRELSWTAKVQGEIRNLTITSTALREKGKTWGSVGVIDDLTLIMKGQRENAWREVAKRIAHEIKNPLTPIKLSAQRLQRRLRDLPGKDGQLLQECTHIIIEHTDELKEMVNEFSNFARFPEVSPTPNQLNDLIQETLQLYSSAHPEVHFVMTLEPLLPIFEIDKEQMRRVLMNLLDNAIAAIKHAESKPERIEIETHYNQILDHAALIIRDNGLGMSEEIQARAFEPYFSTKNQGTGLGLAIVKRIINDHGGYIRVTSIDQSSSEPRQKWGTTFHIDLPTKSAKVSI